MNMIYARTFYPGCAVSIQTKMRQRLARLRVRKYTARREQERAAQHAARERKAVVEAAAAATIQKAARQKWARQRSATPAAQLGELSVRFQEADGYVRHCHFRFLTSQPRFRADISALIQPLPARVAYLTMNPSLIMKPSLTMTLELTVTVLRLPRSIDGTDHACPALAS